jgi:16S rRNA (guanine(966)-N(2))-methyltransferase RsmD
MRIISGKYRGKRLIAPKNLPVRPTADMHKEALFNILIHQYDFNVIRVLDLFSGTGNIAFEFASRGVMDIICVDAHYACVKYIERTARELDFPIISLKSDALKYLRKTKQTFDIIFADPPYKVNAETLSELVNQVFENKLLTNSGQLIIEHHYKTEISAPGLMTEQRKYGSTVFSFFQYPD